VAQVPRRRRTPRRATNGGRSTHAVRKQSAVVLWFIFARSNRSPAAAPAGLSPFTDSAPLSLSGGSVGSSLRCGGACCSCSLTSSWGWGESASPSSRRRLRTSCYFSSKLQCVPLSSRRSSPSIRAHRPPPSLPPPFSLFPPRSDLAGVPRRNLGQHVHIHRVSDAGLRRGPNEPNAGGELCVSNRCRPRRRGGDRSEFDDVRTDQLADTRT